MKILENEFIRYYINNEILHSEFVENTKIDLEKAKIIVDLRHKISDQNNQYWCLDMTNVSEYYKDARDYADKHGQEYIHACAAIVSSHVTKFILNTFIKLKKPATPLKIFTKKEDAMLWLTEIKKKNEE